MATRLRDSTRSSDSDRSLSWQRSVRRRRPRLLAALFAVMIFATLGVGATAPATAAPTAGTYTNPIRDGADPWLAFHDGQYYLASTTAASVITVSTSPSLATLGAATPTVVYDASTQPTEYQDNIWAPEIHRFGDRWYLYYTAQIDGDISTHRNFVAESQGDSPIGPYTFKGQLQGPDFFSIDGTVLEVDDQLYYIYAGIPSPGAQKLYIAPMSNPWTLAAEPRILSEPSYEWEKIGDGETQEGAFPIYRNGKIYLTYSAAQCGTPDYAIGLLTYTGGDPADQASWTKTPDPIFSKSPENGVYGPGHHSFFTSPDGTEDWIVYHARDYANSTDCGEPRTIRAQKINWTADDRPDLGIPAPLGTALPLPAGDPG